MMNRFRFRRSLGVSALALSMGLSSPAVAQVQAPRDTRPPAQVAVPKGTAAISGVVTVSGSGQPARGARVSISGPENFGGRIVTTDDTGRFSFTALPAGRYSLTASKPGFIAASYGQSRPGRQGTPIQLADAGQFAAKLQIYKGGVLTGTVLDERGDAIPRTQVRVIRYVTQGGARTMQSSGSGSTDDRGIYRVFGLQPGDYIVSAMPQNNGPATEADRMREELAMLRERASVVSRMDADQARSITARMEALQAQMPEQEEQATGYAPVYYPGTTNAGEAVMVPLAPAEEKSGLDFQLQRVNIARIEGTVVNPTGQVLPNIQVSLVNNGNSLPGNESTSVRPNPQMEGRFTFNNVAPGQYTIVAQVQQNTGPFTPPPQGTQGPRLAVVRPDPMRYFAMTPVAVDGRSLTNVVLTLQPGMTVSGVIRFEGTTQQPPADLTRMRVNLSSMEGGRGGVASALASSSAGRVDAAGKFSIIGVLPGKYRLTAGSPASGWYLESSVVDGQNTLDTALEIKPSQTVAGAVVTFTDRQTELTGTLTNQRGEPAPDFTIVVYPADPRYWVANSMRIRTTRPATDGKFTVTGLPPGEYRIAPVGDMDQGAQYDAAFLQQLDAGAVRISLADGEKKVQSLRITTGG